MISFTLTRLILIITIATITCFNASAQVITSKSTGGNWNDANTWVGGVVPGQNNDVIINGTVYVTSNSVCNNITINPGVLLTNVDGPVALSVKGNITNNGTIQQEPDNWYFGLDISGNITNNGIWKPAITNLVGSGDQFIAQAAGKCFEDNDHFQNNDSLGTIYASSDLTFKSRVSFFANGGWTTLDMQNHKMTLDGINGYYNKGHVAEIIIKNPGDMIFQNNGVLGWASVNGNPVLKGNAIIDRDTYWYGTITVNDTLRNVAGPISIIINGNIINNGVIKQDPDFWYLGLNISGNITNNGIWKPAITYLVGNGDQYLSQTAGKSFEDTDHFQNNDTLGIIYASSDLTFRSRVNFSASTKWTVLDMQNYFLTLDGINGYYNKGHLTEISIKNVSDMNFINEGVLGWASVTGNPNLKGNVILDRDTYWNGTIHIVDSLRNVSGPITVTVTGDIINNGIVKQDPSYWYLGFTIYGDIYNYNIWRPSKTFIETGNEQRFIGGELTNDIQFDKIDGSGSNLITVDGTFKSKGTLTINTGTVLNIPPQNNFIVGGNLYDWGQIVNDGVFNCYYTIPWAITINTDPALFTGMRVTDKKRADTVWISSMNNQNHPNLNSCIKRWWRISGSDSIGGYALTLKYDDALLNGNDENNLEAFLSTNDGKTWEKISNPVNTTRDLVNNIIVVGNDSYPITKGYGDIILSSGGIVNIPSISSAIGGRKQIRVGPPNRYTISYWNNGDTQTDKFFFVLNTNRGVHIKSVVSKEIVTGNTVEVPVDSLTYDGYKDEVILLIQGLAPKEVRSFDVVLTSEPGTNIAKVNEPITFTAVALWIGGAMLEEYISNTIVEGCYEMWRPVRHDQTLTDASKECLTNSMKKAVNVENGVKGIAKKGAEEIIKKTGRVAVWPVMLAKDIYDCLGNTVKGMKDYVNGNFDKQDKELVKVTSWDPNAKEGPTGYGAEGFMATAAPMSYTIFFENKKEATAAAYEIVIVDTLDPNVFDINSVVFGSMSHSMGVATQEGNILRWQFTEIELPPNVAPPEGEGWVKFIVKPKNNLPTGTQIRNRAVIKFDLNPWLGTNQFVNTLDYDPPVTTPQYISRVPGKNEIEIIWAGTDGSGAGVKNTMVYMANNDGPYTLAAVSDSNSVKIPVEPFVLYKFYTLSTDNVGNSEVTPSKVMEILTSVADDKIIPNKFELLQNYPNPFNPSTTISFALPERGFVELKIYSILGEEITTLMNEQKEAGYYNLKWGPNGIASGIYLYQIKFNSIVQARKMIYLK